MKHLLPILILLVAMPALLTTQMAMAQTTTVEVTIQAVKPEAKEISVEYGEGKSITLDVSRKAKITLNGEPTTLESLGAGLAATVEYHKELAIVTKIVATGKIIACELINVSELQGSSPWFSEDGLTVYWAKDDTICTAQRESPDSYFAAQKELFPGRLPTVSADGLEMVFLAKRNEKLSLHVTTKTSLDGSFSRAREIRELRDVQRPLSPCLSPDGLRLYFNRGGGATKSPMEIVVCSRESRKAPWSMPHLLPILLDGIEKGVLTGAYITSDELSMYCAIEGRGKETQRDNLMLWTRHSKSEPFDNFKYLKFDDSPQMYCFVPRYVAATNELFFTRECPKELEKENEIWVVKNFVPPMPAQP